MNAIEDDKPYLSLLTPGSVPQKIRWYYTREVVDDLSLKCKNALSSYNRQEVAISLFQGGIAHDYKIEQ